MRKILLFVMAIMLFFSFNSSTYAEIEKLNGHWAQGKVDEKFTKDYFDYLAQDNYNSFSPDGNITIGQFNNSVGKLFSEFGYFYNGIKSNEYLTRKDMSLDRKSTRLNSSH